ncbi:hypothetical protein [Mycolicibacterium setense]|uniref:hypothetical protein n=1 Tax=Mycolicibacterium setense TaxID=431269 RepID=UPI0010424C54|nr:hypothetical protein [Mycolicibacterium setense]
MASGAGENSAPEPGCLMCEQSADPERKVVYDTESFVGYATPIYPWAVIVTTRRHDCDGPWALTDAEAVELGAMIPRITDAIRKTGSERVYVMAFNEETLLPHFHVGFLSRYVQFSETERSVLYGRIENTAADLVQVATDFAAAVRAGL